MQDDVLIDFEGAEVVAVPPSPVKTDEPNAAPPAPKSAGVKAVKALFPEMCLK